MNKKTTVELRHLNKEPFFKLFDFNYRFYTDDEVAKKQFEEMFLNHFYRREIGFLTVEEFKFYLKEYLEFNCDYWKKLYETELKCDGINFLLNKDLSETQVIESYSKAKSENENLNNSLTTDDTKNMNRYLDTPENKIISIETMQRSQYLTNVNLTENKGDNKTESSGNSKSENENEGKQTQTLISQGNIGTTSSAQLLRDWRDVLQDMNQIIIRGANDLFLSIF